MLSGQGPCGPWSPFLPLGVFLGLYSSTMLNWLDAPKELQASYLWDHSGAPALALILGRWPEKPIVPQESCVFSSETWWDQATIHAQTHGWLPSWRHKFMTLRYPRPTVNSGAAMCWVRVSALTPPCSDIWQCLVSVLPPPPQGSNGGIILPLFCEPPFTGTRMVKTPPCPVLQRSMTFSSEGFPAVGLPFL